MRDTEKINPIQREKLRQEEELAICREILKNSRNELYLHMRFLDVALSSLGLQGDTAIHFMGTDGGSLYFQPEQLMGLYTGSRREVNRSYLHQIFHCLFCHIYQKAGREEELWDLSCDIAVEMLIDSLSVSCLHRNASAFRREVYGKLKEAFPVVTAQGVYRLLHGQGGEQNALHLLQREFRRDDHSRWGRGQPPAGQSPREQQWQDMREKMQTEMETFSKEASQDTKSLAEQLRVENRQRYDYREFLRKFAVLREEMKVDMDAFDYIFYCYGLELYGNMPLIEPLETREEKRIQDFVIVIDTSMSCREELVRRFLEVTYSILSEADSFFHKLNIHIIQCDDRVQADDVITCREELEEYMARFHVRGRGGTDFRPAFDYVRQLEGKHAFSKLKGLLYFTDGYGIFPVKMPDYDTAFIFMQEDYRDIDVPPWAMKLVIDQEDLTQLMDRQEKAHEY